MPKHESLDDLIAKKAIEYADQMRAAAAMAANEEEIRIESERQLAFIEKETDVKLHGKHEFTVASGRVDSVYSRVIIEYKNPKSPGARIGPKADSPGSKKVIEQIKRRFYDLRQEHGHEMRSLFGVGLDGNYFIFIRFRDEKWQVQEPVEVNRHSAARFLWALFNLGHKGKPFSPEYLAGDFGSEGGYTIAVSGIHALYDAIRTTDNPKAQTFFSQWKILFGEVCGYDVDNPSDKMKKLAGFYHVAARSLKPAELLFAVHTYYALFMKLLAAEIVTFFHREQGGISILRSQVQKLMNANTSASLRRELDYLEGGGIFKQVNITNFLEGDLFAWYTGVWSDPIEKLVRDMVTKLDDYNPGTLSEDPAGSRDLLKQLYQQLFPKSVRHDLGEYYTPDWLAEEVLIELGYVGDPDKRLLDPGCGSGTFLVMAINRIRNWYDQNRERCGFGEDDLCRKILDNVVGFDLNPLAVMAARTNYLIAMRDLIGRVDKVEIPIYLCDSILTPSTYGGLFAGSTAAAKELKTAAAKFLIPSEIATNRDDVAKYAEQLEFCVSKGYSAKEFVARCQEEGLPVSVEYLHTDLYNELVRLDKANKNGVWARIIKNAFAPLFVGRVDFVAGNPPWVNWDNLPDDYRNDTKGLWMSLGLFSLSGTAGKLGGGKKDLSMLFVYQSMKVFLRAGGKLGFVITESLFKTEGGGDGFRKFRFPMPDGSSTPFRVLKVCDLSAIQPFEGAVNRTSVFVCENGRPTEYPVPFPVWLGTKRARVAQDERLEDVLSSVRIVNCVSEPVIRGKITSPWLTTTRDALPGVRKAIGNAGYVAQAGATTCGADGVFLVRPLQKVGKSILVANLHDAGKKEIEPVQMKVDGEFLYQTVRGKDIKRWFTARKVFVLMVQDAEKRVGISESTMKNKHPDMYGYLLHFRKVLLDRRSSMLPKSPFYSIYGVDTQTFSPAKVVWGRVANTVAAAVLTDENHEWNHNETIIPFEAMMVPFSDPDAAHFVCACLNSSIANMIVSGSIVLHPDTHVLRRVAIPRYDKTSPVHKELARLSRVCHDSMARGHTDAVAEHEGRINSTAASLWGITKREVSAIQDALRQLDRATIGDADCEVGSEK